MNGAAATPLTPGQAPQPLGKALCDDPRYTALVSAARATQGKGQLPAQLGRCQVETAEDALLAVRVADTVGKTALEANRDWLAQAWGEITGGKEVEIQVIHDKTIPVPPDATLMGRERLREEARVYHEREAALSDPGVALVQKFFPEAKPVGLEPGKK